MGNEKEDDPDAPRPTPPANRAFEAAEPRIEVEDRTARPYGSRFAHDEHHAGFPAVGPDRTDVVPDENERSSWLLGRAIAIGLAGLSIGRAYRRAARRQRRVVIGSMLGLALAAAGVGAWLTRRSS